ncbi:MAG: hypothetical protein ACN6OP_22545, partial [Pseudomonadales bacterium]
VRRSIKIATPSFQACICKTKPLVARRPVLHGDKCADHGLSTFIFEFLNYTGLEDLNGELFAEAVGGKLEHLGIRGEFNLHYGRLRDVFRAKLSQSAFDTLPDPRTSRQFRAALNGLRPFGDASTALAVGYALFGAVEHLALAMSAEVGKPKPREGLAEKIRRRGSLMTAEERDEVTSDYLHRLGIPTSGESKFTDTRTIESAGPYIAAWLREYGGKFLPPDSQLFVRTPSLPDNLDARDAQMAAYVKAKAFELRKSGFSGRISKHILLEGFPQGILACGKNASRYPLTQEALKAGEETWKSWHIRTTSCLIQEASRLGVVAVLIPTAEKLANMTSQQHRGLRWRLRKSMESNNIRRDLEALSPMSIASSERMDEAA